MVKECFRNFFLFFLLLQIHPPAESFELATDRTARLERKCKLPHLKHLNSFRGPHEWNFLNVNVVQNVAYTYIDNEMRYAIEKSIVDTDNETLKIMRMRLSTIFSQKISQNKRTVMNSISNDIQWCELNELGEIGASIDIYIQQSLYNCQLL